MGKLYNKLPNSVTDRLNAISIKVTDYLDRKYDTSSRFRHFVWLWVMLPGVYIIKFFNKEIRDDWNNEGYSYRTVRQKLKEELKKEDMEKYKLHNILK